MSVKRTFNYLSNNPPVLARPSTNSFEPYLPCIVLLITPRPGILFILCAPGPILDIASASLSTTCPDFF